MTTQPAKQDMTHLLRYTIASADMYYTELEQRDVFLYCDGQGNSRIWGETANGGSSTTIELFEMFLEYALYCCSWADRTETLYNMQNFGERLGSSLAKHLEDIIPLSLSEDLVIQSLKCIFTAEHAAFSTEHVDCGTRFIVSDFPLEKTAEHSGLHNIEFARHGINAMCQSLVHGIDPHLALSTSFDAQSEFIFTILTPSFA
jgi:hypothetical protein